MEKSRHYKKGTSPAYYSKHAAKEIDHLLSNGHAEVALVKCEKYIEDYPRDDLGPFYLAKVYLKLGRKEDSLAITSSNYYTRNFYHIEAKNAAAMIFSDALAANEKYEEAESVLEEMIEQDYLFRSDKLRLQYLTILIKAGKIGKALEEVNGYLKEKNNSPFNFKKGYICFLLNMYQESLNAFKKVSDDSTDNFYQQKYYYMGCCYFELNKKERNNDYLHEADDALRKALEIKNNYYYCACARLSCVNIALDKVVDAEKYALEFLNNKESNKYGYKRNDDAYRSLANVYTRQGKLDKALECIDKMSDDFDRSSTYLRHFLYTKQFDKYLLNANYVLAHAPVNVFHVFVQEYISVLIRLGKLDEAEYMLNWLKDELSEPISERLIAYIRKEKGEEPLDYRFYSSKQIADYSLDEAVKHICDGHLDCDYRPNFACEDDAREALLEAQEALDGLDYLPSGIFNRYILVKDGVGQDKFGKVHGMEAVAIPNTKNIITLYPVTKCMSDYEDEFVSKKVKRLSQIEKFNQKYNKN